MPRYDLCLIRSDGTIDHIVPIQAKDDDDARHRAEQQNVEWRRELWGGSELVGRYPPCADANIGGRAKN